MIGDLAEQINELPLPKNSKLILDCSKIQKLDSIGAWLLQNLMTRLEKNHNKVELKNIDPEHESLLKLIAEKMTSIESVETKKPRENFLVVVGKNAVEKYTQSLDFFVFVGEFVVSVWESFLQPRRLQWRAFLNVIDSAGYRAMPIVGLLSFLVGVVLSYQLGQQLKMYGANLYIVGLLGISVLQEFGPLITAIIGAGRTSSAFTAQIGSMKINEEIDALRTMGVSPFDRLVTPKVLGLIVAMPLLTLWSSAFGLLGGMITSKIQLGVSYYSFLSEFPKIINFSTFANGMIKAPVFAIIISIVGCFQGFQVKFSADSVGTQTTKSVVQALFFIIIADAIFSVIMTWQTLL
jgi:phospholipid/cholesterol/gamma-HCH transport system permease protein